MVLDEITITSLLTESGDISTLKCPGESRKQLKVVIRSNQWYIKEKENKQETVMSWKPMEESTSVRRAQSAVLNDAGRSIKMRTEN